jgi:hypothetical protein
MKAIRFVALWWLALAGWWVLLVGTNAGLELVAGSCAAGIGSALALCARRQGLLRFGFDPAWFVQLLKVPWRAVEGFAVVTWALVLHVARRRVRSEYRTVPLPAEPDGTRALVTLAGALSANTVPLGTEREALLRHELDPRRASRDLP